VVPAGKVAGGRAGLVLKLEIGNSKLENRTSSQTESLVDSIGSHGAYL